MPLAAGDKLGPYEILALIGAGGMGEVYRAHDSRLNRDVAIKVSAAQFTERFDREARAVAALNHPNICHIYDVGPNYLVMEYIEGEAPKGPLPLEEALRIAKQIAEALCEAHDKGITHRDLKPANIKIKPDGTVKVLDFGLAKVDAISGAHSENSPTLSMAATQAGMILGTAGYMSPEQARGKPVDKRADIWAFGVVLYELLTGKRLFEGEDVSHTMAAVIMQEPNLDVVPFEVRKLLRRCLEKDPKKRLRDIGDVWELLEGPPAPSVAASIPAKSRRAMAGWAVAALLFLALAAGAAWHFRPSPPLTVTRFTVPLGEGQQFTTRDRQQLAISPDGTQMVYVANQRLYLRSMSELEGRPIPGTDLGNNLGVPVFSPDGKSLAFFAQADNTLKKMAVSGGAPVTLCQTTSAPWGMSWSEDGIVFEQAGKGIMRVSPDGGIPELLVGAKDDEKVASPQMLPGGQAVLFTHAPSSVVGTAWDKAQIVVQTLKTGARKTVLEGGSDAHYLPTGHLVYALGGRLYAQAFDVKRQEKLGGPVGIVEGVERGPASGSAHFAFSGTGSLVYIPGPVALSGSGADALALFDRKGVAEPLKLQSGTYDFPRVSPDGKRVAYETDDGKAPSIWTYELSEANSANRLTLVGGNRYPIWSSDNIWVAFQSDREGDLGIWRQRADGTGTAERLTKPEKGISHIPDSWSPDGQTFSYTEVKGDTEAVWTYSLRDKKATIFAEAPASRIGRSVFSPDGRWIAYQQRDARAVEVYVQPFPKTATTYQISKDGNGHHPLWSPDQKELFYIPGGGVLATVSVATRQTFTHGTPVTAPSGFRRGNDNIVRRYDILPNGKFIGVTAAGQSQAGAAPGAQIQVVLNWFEEVKQRVPGR
jgi:Tol biopolymer transport system component